MSDKDLINTKGISIIVEFNCEEEGSKASIWVLPGDDGALVTYPSGVDPPFRYYYQNPRARKIVGPMDYFLADEICKGLAFALTDYGLRVKTVTVADD